MPNRTKVSKLVPGHVLCDVEGTKYAEVTTLPVEDFNGEVVVPVAYIPDGGRSERIYPNADHEVWTVA